MQNQNKPEVEVNLKENLKNKGRTHLKPKRQMKLIHMIALTIITTMILIMPQVRVKATDPLMVKVATNNLEVSHNKTEAKDLYIVNVNFRIIDFREVYFNRTVLNMATITNPTFRKIKQITTEAESMAGILSNLEDHGCGRANYQSSNGMYQYQYYTHDPQTEQYGPPCSLCSGFNHSPKHCYKGEHDINNIMEKMSINPHQQQQSNLYQ